MAGNGGKWWEMAGNGGKWREMTGNGRKWRKMAENGGNGGKWWKMVGMAGNGGNGGKSGELRLKAFNIFYQFPICKLASKPPELRQYTKGKWNITSPFAR